jgi:F420-dependent oxidoreductase-like protein
VAIVRQILARRQPLSYDGQFYKLPYQGDDATGLGKPLKSSLRGRADIPIYLAAIGPKNVELAAEIGDGWLPLFFSPQRYEAIYRPHVEAGLAKAGKSLADFDIAPSVQVVIDDSLEVAYNAVRPVLALYVGGMGARGRNFYYDLACRYGYEEAAATIQELFLAGRQGEAMAAVPAGLIDEVALVGPRERVRERLSLWRECPIKSINLMVYNVETLRAVVEMAG